MKPRICSAGNSHLASFMRAALKNSSQPNPRFDEYFRHFVEFGNILLSSATNR